MAKDRSLQSINHKLLRGSSLLQQTLHAMLARRRPLAAVEIGCGTGRALMELAWELRGQPVTFAGINKFQGVPLASSADLLTTAADYGIGTPDEWRSLALPELHFYDATTMHFADGSLDLVYLSSVFRFVRRKLELLAEICRVLRPGGEALLRIGSSGWDYARGPARDDALLTDSRTRLVLRHGGELIPLADYLGLYADRGLAFEFINRPACVLRITRHAHGRVTFAARYEEDASGSMKQLAYGDEASGRAEGGFRSVYSLTDDEHRRLDEAVAPSSGAEAAPKDGASKLARKLQRLAGYAVGQRVQIEGRRDERGVFRLVKMKPVEERQSGDVLEGAIEAIDVGRRCLVVLGWPVDATGLIQVGSHGGEELAFGDLRPGLLVKVTGARRDGVFAAEQLKVQEQPAIITEVLRGAIESLHPEDGTFTLLDLEVLAGEDCKIHEPREGGAPAP